MLVEDGGESGRFRGMSNPRPQEECGCGLESVRDPMFADGFLQVREAKPVFLDDKRVFQSRLVEAGKTEPVSCGGDSGDDFVSGIALEESEQLGQASG